MSLKLHNLFFLTVKDQSGTFVSTYTAADTGGINATYFDWSVGRYATHSGFGTRGGGTEYTWSGGTYDNDSQNYSPVSAVHGAY